MVDKKWSKYRFSVDVRDRSRRTSGLLNKLIAVLLRKRKIFAFMFMLLSQFIVFMLHNSSFRSPIIIAGDVSNNNNVCIVAQQKCDGITSKSPDNVVGLKYLFSSTNQPIRLRRPTSEKDDLYVTTIDSVVVRQ